MMTGNVIISEVDDLVYVVLNMAEKKHMLWRISWYHRMHNAIDEVSHKPKSL
jgi:hypothetical protein